ncbi:MAG TPA: DUF3570 domain-containing protein [Rhodocyclaceae bacterium]
MDRLTHNDPAKAASASGCAVGTAALMAAALALPGIQAARAETAPDRGVVSVKFLDYQDSQPGADRIRVTAPSMFFLAPFADGRWSASGTYTVDAISGASPAFHTRALTRMRDDRHAYNGGVTRYFQDGTLTLGAAYSRESDYLSRGFSLQGTHSSEDKNTSFNLGVAMYNDEINPTNRIVRHETKQVAEYLAGVTQILTPYDIVQAEIGTSRGRGYFSDPYKTFDQRPRRHDHATVLARWNHHFSGAGGTSRLSYRYYNDNYGIIAHTAEAEYVQPLPGGWTLQPSLRLYTQKAATFYVEVDPARGDGITFPSAAALYNSRDQRLSAFGAATLGLKVVKDFGPDWSLDVKYERYEQRSEWARNAQGSYGLAPFQFRAVQFGITHRF